MPDCTPTQEALSEELDKALLAAVKAARSAAKDGEPVNAALLNAATSRLKALGITKLVTADSVAAKLAEECGLGDPNVLKFPDISTEPDLASEAM